MQLFTVNKRTRTAEWTTKFSRGDLHDNYSTTIAAVVLCC